MELTKPKKSTPASTQINKYDKVLKLVSYNCDQVRY